MNVKNYERSEISLHLQANMFIFHSFMDTGHRFWLRGKGQYNTQIIAFARVTSLVSISWAPVPRAMQLGPGGITFSCLHYRRRTLRFRKKKKLLAKLFTICPTGRPYLYYPGPQIILVSSPYRFLNFKCYLLYKHSQKGNPEHKCHCLCSKDVQKYERFIQLFPKIRQILLSPKLWMRKLYFRKLKKPISYQKTCK